MKRLLTSAALLLGLSLAPAYGQTPATAKTSAVWFSQGRLSSAIAVTASSAPTALPAAGFVASLCNTGTNDGYLKFGTDNTVTVTVAAGSWLKAGTCGAYDLRPFGTLFTWVALITPSSTTTVAVETGQGTPPNPLVATGGGGGGGGLVTIGDGTRSPVAVKAGNTAATTDLALVVADPNVLAAINAQIPACTSVPCNVIGFTSNDVCSQAAKKTVNFFQSATSKVIPGVSAKITYVCASDAFTSAAATYGFIEGTGSSCGTGIAVVKGMSNTTTPKMALAANGGWTFGSGAGTVFQTAVAGDDMCIVQSGTADLSGGFSVVQQ